MKWVALILTLFLSYGTALASTPSGQDNSKWENWPTVGKANLKWLFFNLFNSELKSPSGRYELTGDITPHPMALSIVYQRDISKEQLVKATRDQWQYLGYSPQQQQLWLSELARMLPSVQKGESLVYVTDGKTGELHFYDSERQMHKLGEISNETLNDAFLSIWLAPGTEYPKHRAKLIGN